MPTLFRPVLENRVERTITIPKATVIKKATIKADGSVASESGNGEFYRFPKDTYKIINVISNSEKRTVLQVHNHLSADGEDTTNKNTSIWDWGSDSPFENVIKNKIVTYHNTEPIYEQAILNIITTAPTTQTIVEYVPDSTSKTTDTVNLILNLENKLKTTRYATTEARNLDEIRLEQAKLYLAKLDPNNKILKENSPAKSSGFKIAFCILVAYIGYKYLIKKK